MRTHASRRFIVDHDDIDRLGNFVELSVSSVKAGSALLFAAQLSIQLVEQSQTEFRSAALRPQSVTILGVGLCQRHGGPFLDELIEAHAA